MIDCDKDCARCTYAACMVDEHEEQRNPYSFQNRRPKKKIKIMTPTERIYFEQEYTHQSSMNYDY